MATRDSAIGVYRDPTPIWTFGDPVLKSANSGHANWIKDLGDTEALFQKGTSGYLAELYAGAQSGDDWSAVFIPVNELPVPDFNSALWTYRLTSAEAAGVNLVIWLHDPTDNDKRVEVTQVMGLVDHADGWNAHELDTSVSQFFYYGEGESGMDVCVAEGTNYTWAQYQIDALFSGWTIYRISLEYGWIGSTTLDPAWLADLKLNGQVILIRPRYEWRGMSPIKSSGVLTTDTALKTTPGDVYWLTISDTAATVVQINDSPADGGSDVWQVTIPADGYGHFIFDPPIHCESGIFIDIPTGAGDIIVGYI